MIHVRSRFRPGALVGTLEENTALQSEGGHYTFTPIGRPRGPHKPMPGCCVEVGRLFSASFIRASSMSNSSSINSEARARSNPSTCKGHTSDYVRTWEASELKIRPRCVSLARARHREQKCNTPWSVAMASVRRPSLMAFSTAARTGQTLATSAMETAATHKRLLADRRCPHDPEHPVRLFKTCLPDDRPRAPDKILKLNMARLEVKVQLQAPVGPEF